ncbi:MULTISPECIES: hypothetical protein [Bacteria]|uniref:Uridine kinase n=1 Tax=Oceanobacillus kimchii TaxID=746691 RepID=A0ABQ5TD42_9BACI|nr:MULTISPECIES: hypothetical protein [Bacteria]MBT2653108.1 phosphoribulokinase [Oceanobacillus sp. ISL-73]GLO64566.1 uridine kinase [Oceanobacillus kimchii]
MDELLTLVVNWIKKQDGKLIIGISGHGASGKTTFATKLKALLQKEQVNILNTDPYIIDSVVRKKSIMEYTYKGNLHHYKMTASHPSAHHLVSLTRDIRMIQNGLDLLTLETQYSESKHIYANVPITIVEGMSVAFIEPNIFDLRIYLYTDDETEFIRRMHRDVADRGANKEYIIFAHKERRVQYKLFMHKYHEDFDIVINNSNTGWAIVKNVLMEGPK